LLAVGEFQLISFKAKSRSGHIKRKHRSCINTWKEAYVVIV